MMKKINGMVLLAAIAWTSGAVAQHRDITPSTAKTALIVDKQPGTINASGEFVVRGTITAINAERREITVKRLQGGEIIVPAGQEVRNFDQIKVGDQVVLRQSQSLALSLKKTNGKNSIRERSDKSDTKIAKLGEKPSIAASREVRVIADVTAVDVKAGTVTLRGVHESRTLRVRDPAILKNIKKGDQVEAVLVEGEALSVEEASTR